MKTITPCCSRAMRRDIGSVSCLRKVCSIFGVLFAFASTCALAMNESTSSTSKIECYTSSSSKISSRAPFLREGVVISTPFLREGVAIQDHDTRCSAASSSSSSIILPRSDRSRSRTTPPTLHMIRSTSPHDQETKDEGAEADDHGTKDPGVDDRAKEAGDPATAEPRHDSKTTGSAAHDLAQLQRQSGIRTSTVQDECSACQDGGADSDVDSDNATTSVFGRALSQDLDGVEGIHHVENKIENRGVQPEMDIDNIVQHERLDEEEEKWAIALVSNDDYALARGEEVPARYRDNEAVVTAAVSRNGIQLTCASDRLKQNKAVVLAAVRNNGYALLCAMSVEEAERELHEAQGTTPPSSEAVPPNYSSSSSSPTSLSTSSSSSSTSASSNQRSWKNMRDDFDVVLAAVTQNGMTFRYASQRLKNDPRIVTAAVLQQPYAMRYASVEMRANRSVAFAALDGVDTNDLALLLENLSPELRDDEELVLAIVERSGRLLWAASPRLRGNERVARAAILNYPEAIAFVSRTTPNYSGLAWLAVQQDLQRQGGLAYSLERTMLPAYNAARRHMQAEHFGGA
ncbi:unnamed protein product [Amoebophrya sp. A25]|nr:unnamed protein product [Amoebophrya sp. A25]|eukprot:GSA25T00026785001.1